MFFLVAIPGARLLLARSWKYGAMTHRHDQRLDGAPPVAARVRWLNNHHGIQNPHYAI